MGPKSKKASAAEKAQDVQETEDPLQALVLADSFETRFKPFTKDTPRCLLPLANTPLIEYTLEFLANSGVEEVYIYCGAHTDQIESYLQSTKWTTPSSPFTLTTLRSSSRTIGDAMRDLDSRELLTNDFLICYGDVVSNLSIEPALKEHQARRLTDKNAIMTMVLRDGGANAHQGAAISPVFITDPAKKRVLQYEQIQAKSSSPHSTLLDSDVLALGIPEMEIRADLLDPGIDICTPDVLALWQDNFDYEAPRRGFLHSVLKDYELNGKTIHTFIEQEGYANRVRDLRSYHRVSEDVLGRWAWPMGPDGVFGGESGECRMGKGGVLREEGVGVSKSASVGRRTLLGRGTVVGARTRVEGSVIGRGCKIGQDCVIEGAYLWDGVEVKDGTTIRRSIIAQDCVMGGKSTIAEGTLVARGVHIPDNTTTQARQRLVKSPTSTDLQEYDPSSSEDEAAPKTLLPSPSTLNRTASTHSISTLSSSRPPSPTEANANRRPSTTSLTSVTSEPTSTTDPTTSSSSSAADFHREASLSILDALLKSDDPANIQIELQGLRMAANASEHAVRRAVVAGLIGYILRLREEGSKVSIKSVVEENGDLIKRVVYDNGDQVDLLLCVQRELVAGKGPGEELLKDRQTVLLSVLNALYGEDLVEGEAVVKWWEDERGVEGEGMRSVRGHRDMERLVGIAKAEGESSGSGSGEEEESEEDEESD